MSDKALLVMDMPENGCAYCSICRESFLKTICGITGKSVSGNRERGGVPEECPLKQVPEKKPVVLDALDCYGNGWNACIDEITGVM